MLGLLLAVTVTSAAAGDGAAAPQVPKKAANFGVRQVAWMPLAVEQDELRRPVHSAAYRPQPNWKTGSITQYEAIARPSVLPSLTILTSPPKLNARSY